MTSQQLTVKIDHLNKILASYQVEKPLIGITLHFTHPNDSLHWLFNDEQKEISNIIPLVIERIKSEIQTLEVLLPSILQAEQEAEQLRLQQEAQAEAERLAQQQAEQEAQAKQQALITKINRGKLAMQRYLLENGTIEIAPELSAQLVELLGPLKVACETGTLGTAVWIIENKIPDSAFPVCLHYQSEAERKQSFINELK